ncbi:MAG: endonuclease III [Pseudomonadota bacterium]|nr:endonuclease III [Pseudomonadota bacterium]
MRKLERVNFIIEHLMNLYPETPRPLDSKSTFQLLIAVLLSAQCTDERVNKVTPELFDRGEDSFSMAKLPFEEIYRIIRPCGLAPKKARAILNLSNILIQKFNGEVPENIELLEMLPGVGHKTACVVMSQGFGHSEFPVDTHIHRLSQRWKLTNGKSVIQTEKDLKRAFPKKLWNKLHLQMIFYGRQHCTARGCDGRICDICRTCFPGRKTPILTRKA